METLEQALFGHTAYGTAYGLVAASMAEEFLLFLFSQSHHSATAGTWTFWEKVLLDRSKSMCCFAAPAQLTVPCALRWALVFEDEANGLVALARTLPRAWFVQSNASLSLEHAAVSHQLISGGSVGFSLQRDGAACCIIVSVAVSGTAGTTLKTLSLRLRFPLVWGNVTSITSGSGGNWLNKLEGDVLKICDAGRPLPGTGELQGIRIEFSRTSKQDAATPLKNDDRMVITKAPPPTCHGSPKPPGAGCGPAFSPGDRSSTA